MDDGAYVTPSHALTLPDFVESGVPLWDGVATVEDIPTLDRNKVLLSCCRYLRTNSRMSMGSYIRGILDDVVVEGNCICGFFLFLSALL